MKFSEQSSLLLNCSFLSKNEFVGKIEQALQGPSLTHIVTLNAEMVVEAQHNEDFRAAVERAELKIPDGSSMLWAREYLSGGGSLFFSLIKFLFSKQQPLTGVDSIFDICEAVERKNGTVYLLGGTHEEGQGTKRVLQKRYPSISVIVLADDGVKTLPATTYNLQPNSALFVALGSPKQTLYIEHHRKILEESGIRIAVGVGGAFAMISGILPRAPRFMRRHHLEWLWRLLLEPKRIKRIWNATVVFPNIVRGYPH